MIKLTFTGAKKEKQVGILGSVARRTGYRNYVPPEVKDYKQWKLWGKNGGDPAIREKARSKKMKKKIPGEDFRFVGRGGKEGEKSL